MHNRMSVYSPVAIFFQEHLRIKCHSFMILVILGYFGNNPNISSTVCVSTCYCMFWYVCEACYSNKLPLVGFIKLSEPEFCPLPVYLKKIKIQRVVVIW